MKKLSLCTLPMPLDVVELTFTGSRSRSCLMLSLTKHKFKVKKSRPEWDSNPESPVLESSTLTITPQKTANFVEHYSTNNI